MQRVAVLLVVGCGGPPSPQMPDSSTQAPVENLAREIVDTKLTFDLASHAATAVITFGASEQPGATLEVGDLMIDSVRAAGSSSEMATVRRGDHLDLGLEVAGEPRMVEFAFHYKDHKGFEGSNSGGFTFVWPYFCGNLFPCHSDPRDGTTFTLDVTGAPAGMTAIFPPAIATQAPSYQVAFAVDAYQELALGTTTAGTSVSMWHRAADQADAMRGGTNLVAVFDWYEKTIGPYRFGNKVGTVAIHWPIGAFGGMEHHPLWHVSAGSLASEETNAHEAAHGWFGDGVRIGCWEDFVLSEGTVTYLAGRALEVVAPAVGAATWNDYAQQLAALAPTDPVWPMSCNQIDIIKDNLFTSAPYIRGAFFYRALAGKLGADKVDQILAAFYAAHAGSAATMQDMLATIESVASYDATACATSWLRSAAIPPIAPCP